MQLFLLILLIRSQPMHLVQLVEPRIRDPEKLFRHSPIRNMREELWRILLSADS